MLSRKFAFSKPSEPETNATAHSTVDNTPGGGASAQAGAARAVKPLELESTAKLSDTDPVPAPAKSAIRTPDEIPKFRFRVAQSPAAKQGGGAKFAWRHSVPNNASHDDTRESSGQTSTTQVCVEHSYLAVGSRPAAAQYC